MSGSARFDLESLPPLARDKSYQGVLVTQFLGAFNDNVFKQLVLLMCVDLKARSGTDYQGYALALFAIPFVLFSGLGGYLSDRYSKRTIVVLCKAAEILVMLAGLLAFIVDWGSVPLQVAMIFAVLFMMSTQSAFFGPSKYGILPELFRDRDLPAANGFIQMTTFVAIIFGMSLAGLCKEWLGDQFWWISVMCVGIAVIGTATSTLIRRTPAAHASLPFRWQSLGINRETWQLMKSDHALMLVLFVSSLFWFIGGIVQPTVNDFGILQMKLGDGRTSLMAACMGIGIAIGCVLAGKLSHRRIDFRLVTIGAWGIVGHLLFLGWVGHQFAVREAAAEPVTSGMLDWLLPATLGELLARLGLTGLGIMAGLFTVPLQVFLQSRPPSEQKGRMIGAMNLLNWLGIVASAIIFKMVSALQQSLGETAAGDPRMPISTIFPVVGLLMIPVALKFRSWLRHTGVDA